MNRAKANPSEREREALAKVIASFPCGRCDPDGTKTHCSEHSESCWNLYRQEASRIQSIFIEPLRMANLRLKLIGAALTLACAVTLIVPAKVQRHHVLEVVVAQAMQSAERAIPIIEQDIAKAVAVTKALAKDPKTADHASK